MSGRNGVGAAWSAYRMVTYEPAHGAEICPVPDNHLAWLAKGKFRRTR